MALTTQLRVFIEGDATGLIGQLTKAGRESKHAFSEVSRSAKAEFAAATKSADAAFKEVARLQSQANRADKGGQSGLANALRSQAAAKAAEAHQFATVAVAAEKKIQAEAAKTVAAHAAEASGVSKLGSAYAQQGGVVSRFLGAFTGNSGAATKGVTALKDAVGGLNKGTGLLGGVTTAATAGLQGLGAKSAGAGAGLGVMAAGATAAAVGVGLIGKTVESGLKHFVDFGREVTRVKNITGATAEDASLLAGQFRHFGIDVDAGAKALGIFAKNAVQNSGKKLRDLGIDIAHTKDGSVDLTQSLVNAGDKFKSFGKSAEGTNLALQAFGRGGAALIPILASDRKELEAINRATSKQGLKFSEKDRKDAIELGISIRELHHSFEGLQVSAAKGLAPLFTEQTEGAANFLDSINAVTQKVGGLGGILKKVSGESGLAGIAKIGAESLPGVGQAVNVLSGFGKGSSQAAKDQAVLQQAISDTGEETSSLVADLLNAGNSMSEITARINESGHSVDELASMADISPEFDATTAAMTRTANAATFAGEQADTLHAKLDLLSQGAISVQASETSLAGGLASLGKALKDNGADFNNNTEHGRENRKAMEEQASGILANVNLLEQQGGTIGEVSNAWDRNVDALVRTLKAGGATDQTIQTLLRDYGLIPATKETIVNAVTADALKKLAELQSAYDHLHATDLQVNIAGGLRTGSILVPGKGRAQATGGRSEKGRQYQVGEGGPELWVQKVTGHKSPSAMEHLTRQGQSEAHETLVRLGIPGGIEPRATRKGAPALLLGTQGPQMFTPPADGVIVNATDTKRLQRTQDPGIIERILKRAGADRKTLEALASTSGPARAGGGAVKHDRTYATGEKGTEAYVPSFNFGSKATTPAITTPGVKRGSDGSYNITIGDTHLKVEAGTSGSAKGINKSDVDKIVERKQAELVQELIAAMRSG